MKSSKDAARIVLLTAFLGLAVSFSILFSTHSSPDSVVVERRTPSIGAISQAMERKKALLPERELVQGADRDRSQPDTDKSERVVAVSQEDQVMARYLRDLAATHGLELSRPPRFTRRTWQDLRRLYRASLPRRTKLALELARVARRISRAKAARGEYEDHPRNIPPAELKKLLAPRLQGQYVTAVIPPDPHTLRIVRIDPGENRSLDELRGEIRLGDLGVLQAVRPFLLQSSRVGR